MQIVQRVAEMQRVCRDLRRGGAVVGMVPTMGALHEGHLSLVRRARADSDAVVASIFVNPLQFAPGEDLAKYPRTFEEDCRALEREGVDLLFVPQAEEMYPGDAVTTVTVSGVGDRLDGASRPGHFTGVATVVSKLFHIVGPTRAYFGQKDAAQLAVLRQMVKDLNFDVEMIACPIVRDTDGLALSSRNRYLSGTERKQALALHQAMLRMQELIAKGERRSELLLAGGMEVLQRMAGVRLDYLSVVDADTLLPVMFAEKGSLVAVAAFVGTTRLIDNFLAA
jgi:pantoate--beta-alanine ligase